MTKDVLNTRATALAVPMISKVLGAVAYNNKRKDHRSLKWFVFGPNSLAKMATVQARLHMARIPFELVDSHIADGIVIRVPLGYKAAPTDPKAKAAKKRAKATSANKDKWRAKIADALANDNIKVGDLQAVYRYAVGITRF